MLLSRLTAAISPHLPTYMVVYARVCDRTTTTGSRKNVQVRPALNTPLFARAGLSRLLQAQ